MSNEAIEPGALADVDAEAQAGGEKPDEGILLRGTAISPGLVLGRVHRKDYDLGRAQVQRVPRDQVDRELNRFRKSLDDSARQLRDLKTRLEGRVHSDDARILDTHLAYLKDSVFIADVENLILGDQMGLEGAIAKVIGDFDRIFHLVENQTLRQSAVDLRDVAIRVLRNLEQAGEGEPESPEPTGQYVLLARELCIVDMFNLANDQVLGIATEEGGLTSHAAVFARSMRIPTVTAVEGLLDEVHEGDFVILDASEAVLRVNPPELVRQQYREGLDSEAEEEPDEGLPAWASRETRTHDGEQVRVEALCGNLPEVELAARYGMGGVGLYRTELLYLIDRNQPTREALVGHYSSVCENAGEGPVTVRLLHVTSHLEIPYLHSGREMNPRLGSCGVRLLLEHEGVLRRQLQAILIAARDTPVRIAVPFVVDCGELRRIKEILFEEKLELRRSQTPFREEVELGCVVETPAAVLGIRDLTREADFLTVNLDSLTQYLLAADRENGGLASYFEAVHPFVLRALTEIVDVTCGQGKCVSIFGLTAGDPANLPLLLGAGLREFCLAPAAYEAFLDQLVRTDAREAARAARAAARSSCREDMQTQIGTFRHGFARG